jgi:hypothetical protein
MIRSHLKNRILVQDSGGAEFKTAGPPKADRGFKTRHQQRYWPKDIFELASKVALRLDIGYNEPSLISLTGEMASGSFLKTPSQVREFRRWALWEHNRKNVLNAAGEDRLANWMKPAMRQPAKRIFSVRLAGAWPSKTLNRMKSSKHLNLSRV